MIKLRKELRTEAIIRSTPQKIWMILTGFNSYPEWNPFITSLTGNAVTGNTISAVIKPSGGNGMTIRPKILRVEKNRELRWKGHLVIPGLFDGEHIFELIENNDGSTTFVQREMFSGILIPLFRKLIDENTRSGFEAMNLQLKMRAENLP